MKKFLVSLISLVLLIGSSTVYAKNVPAIMFKVAAEQADTTLKLRLSFDNVPSGATTVTDESGNSYVATLASGATVSASGGVGGVLNLGTTNSYLDLGAQLGSGLISKLQNFTISTYIYIANDAVITTAGNFVFAFGNSADIGNAKNGTMFFSAMNTRYAICTTDWHTEQSTPGGSAFTKGAWKHLAITYTAATTKIYIDGVLLNTTTSITTNPKSLGSTAYNFIGRSTYSADAYLPKTMVDEFRIYNRVLPDTSIVRLASSLPDYQTALTRKTCTDALSTINLVDGQKIISNLTLPTFINGVSISWNSSDESTISTTGNVVRPAHGSASKDITLTATATSGGVSATKIFVLTVLPSYTNSEVVTMDADSLILSGNIDNLRASLILLTAGIQGSSIVWSSNTPSLLANDGKLLYLPEHGTGKTHVVLTATITKGDVTQAKTFDVYVAEKEGYSAYMFAYFTGTSEAIRFALSNDGKNYRALNNNNQVLNSSSISSTGGVRDPHIMRAEDGQTFYMVATDMVAANGWDSNRAMVLLKSTDLVNWTSSVVNVMTTYPVFADVKRVWAPQTIYDKSVGKYMIYWSMKLGNIGMDKVYYAYANANFTALESEPKLLFENPAGTATIDADIIEKGGKFYMFMKTENAGNGIKKGVASTLTGPYAMEDKFLDQSDLDVEGGCVYRLTDTDNYILMYDIYKNQKYQFTQSSDLDNFKVIDNETSMNFAPRHGTTMAITKEEAERLAQKWGTAADIYIYSSASDYVKMINSKYDQTAKTISLAVKKGTDLSSLDPKFITPAGCVVTPAGPQDFSTGAVNYTVSVSGIGSKTYAVTAHVSGNPVLEGYYADPDILYSKKNNKFYIYPTSDGFLNWSGKYFKAFSSPDLVNWTDEGVILDLPTQVSWGQTNAWAPCIEEKMVNGAYKYFYYFTAAQKIGVAVSDNPTGPFVDSGAALISTSPTGNGQQIDPDVFTDSISGKSYLYWGNNYMAVAELNDNMTSLKSGTTKVITPTNGTFTEGTYVIKRNNTYYFFWSKGDTRKVDYSVYYGMSTSPTGPFTIPANNHILVQNPALGIYGTGHNSVIQIPGRDEWYMVYHRFTRPRGITMTGDSAGYYREVCIDKLEFNADGTIKPIVPTIEGILPVSFPNPNTAVPVVNYIQPKGNVISIELYSINGLAVNYRYNTLEKGVYLVKKKHDSGAVSFKKIIISNPESQKYFFKD